MEAVTAGIEANGAVIAIVPTWFAPEALMRLEMVRSILDTERLAIHPTALPPLAGAALASLASALGPHTPGPGVLASMLPELEAELHVITWLGSVSGLSTPSPTLAQHMASLTPGTAFGVSSFPEPSVHKLRGGAPTVPLPEIARPSRLVVAPRQGDARWITETPSPTPPARRSSSSRASRGPPACPARSASGSTRTTRTSSPTPSASPRRRAPSSTPSTRSPRSGPCP